MCIYICVCVCVCVYKQDLPLNNLQVLICHKTNQQTNHIYPSLFIPFYLSIPVYSYHSIYTILFIYPSLFIPFYLSILVYSYHSIYLSQSIHTILFIYPSLFISIYPSYSLNIGISIYRPKRRVALLASRCKIHRLHLCRWVRLPSPSVLDMTLNNLMVRLQ